MLAASYRRLGLGNFIPVVDPADTADVRFIKIASVELVGKSLPEFWISNDFQKRLLKLFEDEVKHIPYGHLGGVFLVSGAVISMPSAVVRLGNGIAASLMGGSTWFLRNPRYLIGFLSSLFVSCRSVKYESGALISLPFDNNYFHWLIETLPRLSLLEAQADFSNKCPLYLPNISERPSFVWDGLNSVGWGHKIKHLPNGSYRMCRLLVPTLTAPRGHISKDALLWLRQKFLIQNNSVDFAEEHDSSRIYVARDDALVRRVINSNEVDALMTEFGFRKVVMAGKTISEQASIFSSASLIVGIHGAALANVAFCRRGSTLLEIFMDGWFTKAYFNLSRQLEMSYGCFLAENVGGHMKVDVASLRLLLERIVRSS